MGARNYGKPKCELFKNIHVDIQNIATNIIYNYYVPKFLPLTLIQTRNGDKQFWKWNFHATNGIFFPMFTQHDLIMFFWGSPSSQVVP